MYLVPIFNKCLNKKKAHFIFFLPYPFAPTPQITSLIWHSFQLGGKNFFSMMKVQISDL